MTMHKEELGGKTRGQKIAELRLEIAALENDLAVAKDELNKAKVELTETLVIQRGGYDALGKNEDGRKQAIQSFLDSHHKGYVVLHKNVMLLEAALRLKRAALEGELDLRQEDRDYATDKAMVLHTATESRKVDYLFTLIANQIKDPINL